MVHFGEFWKPEACGQTVLPDRSLLIGQKSVENTKFKWDILGDFQTMWGLEKYVSSFYWNACFSNVEILIAFDSKRSLIHFLPGWKGELMVGHQRCCLIHTVLHHGEKYSSKLTYKLAPWRIPKRYPQYLFHLRGVPYCAWEKCQKSNEFMLRPRRKKSRRCASHSDHL